MLTMKALRIEKEMSQQAVAEYLGVTQPMVSYIENGEVPCPEEHKEALRSLFGVPNANDLFIPYQEYLRRI